MWTRARVSRLAGPQFAMYLVALDFYRTDRPEASLTFGQSIIRDLYGLGDSSRRAGLAGLVDRDVLWVERQALDNRGDRLGRLTARNVYQLAPSWRPPEPRQLDSTDEQ